MKIILGSDHGGFERKEELALFLCEAGYDVEDLGCYSTESVDYPDIAAQVAKEVVKQQTLGVLVCGTGIGMAISANKIPGCRAANVSDSYSARMLREHNDGNVICLGGRVLGLELHKEILMAFLHAEFGGGRHQRRVSKINALEQK